MNKRSNLTHIKRLLAANRILNVEYEAARAALTREPGTVEAWIMATCRLKVFLRTRAIPPDVAKKLNLVRRDTFHHVSNDDLESYYLNRTSSPTELAVVEEHLLWCHDCLDRLESIERFVKLLRAGAARDGIASEPG